MSLSVLAQQKLDFVAYSDFEEVQSKMEGKRRLKFPFLLRGRYNEPNFL